KELDCEKCTALTNISVMVKLVYLYCKHCTALTNISVMPKLKELNCKCGTALTAIPVLPNLNVPVCKNCTSLTDIPILPELYDCKGCKWFQECDDFESNINALRSCQAIVKRKLTAKKLERVIPVITEIYYSPGCKGEYLSGRSFLAK